MKRSTVPYLDTEFGSFKNNCFEARELAGYYVETLAYAPLCSDLKDDNIYGDIIMSLSTR